MRASIGLGGPVGFAHATIGFSVAVLVARIWEYVAKEAHCQPECPTFTSQAIRLHHFYYGLGLLTLSLSILIFARRQRVRWDSSLFFGIGMGLLADEFGLLLLAVPYTSPLSILVVTIFAGTLILGTINSALRDGTMEFRTLDLSDGLTVAGILLGLGGIVYLDRPIMPLVESLGALFWSLALILLLSFGRRHFQRTLVGPG